MSGRSVAVVVLLFGAALVGVGAAQSDATASIDQSSLPLQTDEQQVLLGETSLEGGTELTVRLQSTSGSQPFLRQETVYVSDNGTFAAVFDMSTATANTTFEVTVLYNGTTLVEDSGTVVPCSGNCSETVPDLPGVPDTVVSTERGSVTTIPVAPENDTVLFSLGNTDGTYLVNATLTDGNGDGEVRLRVDTAAAGTAGETLSVVDISDSITVTREEPDLGDPIDPGEYDFRVYDGETATGAPVSNGLLTIETNESTSTGYEVSDTAGCNKLKEFATPGWRISLRTYSRQYDDPELGFADSVYVDRQGSVVVVNVTIAEASAATVTIGGPENGYQINATVSDGDGDGRVALLFDTAAAGRSGETLRVAADGDSVTPVPGSEVDRDTHIDAGDYDLDLYRGSNVTGGAEDVATLTLQSGNVSSATDSGLAVTAERTADGGRSGSFPVGVGAIAFGGLLALGGVALVVRTLFV